MPRKEIDYSKTVIYKIVCNDLNIIDCYVGSTTDFTKRKNNHKKCCHKEIAKGYNYTVYAFIRQNGGWDNWAMIEIEKYPCADGNEAKARERYWIEKLNAKLNKVIPGRSQQEYHQTAQYKKAIKINYAKNKEKILQYQKEYRQKNKNNIKEQRKLYREKNHETICLKKREFYQQNKTDILKKQKEYKDSNREHILQKNLKYYQNNKNTILDQRKESFICVCGTSYTKYHKARHEKTKKHIQFMEQQNENQ
jgi:hypothetical protein